MNDHNGKYARLRDIATGALAALATVGAIAGTAALAANPHTSPHCYGAAASSREIKTPTSPAPDKTKAPQPPVNHRPFLTAIQRLVDNGTITPTERQAVDREIQGGRVDTETLTSSGFIPTQLQAVQQALGNTKRAVARNVR